MAETPIAPLGHKQGFCNKTHEYGVRDFDGPAGEYKSGRGRCVICVRCGVGKYTRVNGASAVTWSGQRGYYYGCHGIMWGQYDFDAGDAIEISKLKAEGLEEGIIH